MQMTVGEAVAAYNSDPNESGASPLQMVTGRNPHSYGYGDVLDDLGGRLAEHSLLEAKPSLAKQVAVRETARVAMVRLHYSRGLRQAELARSRRSTAEEAPQPGDLVFFWRAQKYNSKKEQEISQTRRRLILRRWHLEGKNGTEFSANCFISFRGQLTKCPLEHVRKASSLESIAAGSWEAAIEDVLRAVRQEVAVAQDVAAPEEAVSNQPPNTPADAGFQSGALTPVLAPALTTTEVIAALRPEGSAAMASGSRRQSLRLEDVASLGGSSVLGQTEAPKTTRLMSSSSWRSTLDRARSLDVGVEKGRKRAASEELSRPPREEALREEGIATSDAPADAQQLEERPAFEALTMTWEQLCNVAEASRVHPLLQLQVQAEMDRRAALDCLEEDHGTWDGRWAFLCEREWDLARDTGLQFPCGSAGHEALSVQAARKEYAWSQLSPAKKELWREAAVKGWSAYVDNEAVQVLSMEESAKVRKDLLRRGELDRIMQPRFVLTDKHDGLRTSSHPLPIKASSRLVVPGFKDKTNLEGNLHWDAHTGSRFAQHLLFLYGKFLHSLGIDFGRCEEQRRSLFGSRAVSMCSGWETQSSNSAEAWTAMSCSKRNLWSCRRSSWVVATTFQVYGRTWMGANIGWCSHVVLLEGQCWWRKGAGRHDCVPRGRSVLHWQCSGGKVLVGDWRGVGLWQLGQIRLHLVWKENSKSARWNYQALHGGVPRELVWSAVAPTPQVWSEFPTECSWNDAASCLGGKFAMVSCSD